MGAMAEAGRALKQAVANAEKLVTMNDEGDRGGLRGCEQRLNRSISTDHSQTAAV